MAHTLISSYFYNPVIAADEQNRIREAREFIKQLSKEDRTSIFNFTEFTYISINKLLSGALHADTEPTYDKIVGQIGVLDALFDRAPKLTSNIVVYRGMSPSTKTRQARFSTLGNDKTCTNDMMDKRFISTSTDIRVAFDNVYTSETLQKNVSTDDMCCVFVINIPAGIKVLAVEDISSYPEEHEIILNRNTKLRFVEHKIEKLAWTNSDTNVKYNRPVNQYLFEVCV
jgi:hypothetical protein